MSDPTIQFGGKIYPKLQSEGFASQYAFPFASKLLKGKGVDVGCMKPEWAFPGAIPVDLDFEDDWHAMNLPESELDYIFSSHCLEHLPDWVGVLDYWYEQLKVGGLLFLYLPSYQQEYWKPWHNRKHVNVLEPHIIRDYLQSRGKWQSVIVTDGFDLNHSFYATAIKV